jgi:hypothetical protein
LIFGKDNHGGRVTGIGLRGEGVDDRVIHDALGGI